MLALYVDTKKSMATEEEESKVIAVMMIKYKFVYVPSAMRLALLQRRLKTLGRSESDAELAEKARVLDEFSLLAPDRLIADATTAETTSLKYSSLYGQSVAPDFTSNYETREKMRKVMFGSADIYKPTPFDAPRRVQTLLSNAPIAINPYALRSIVYGTDLPLTLFVNTRHIAFDDKNGQLLSEVDWPGVPLLRLVEYGVDLSNEMLTDVTCQMLLCVATLHSLGRAHGNLSPHSFYVTTRGEIKLGDFECASSIVAPPLFSRRLAYPSGFAPPEFRFEGPCNFYDCMAGDVWACGAILWTLIVRQWPAWCPALGNAEARPQTADVKTTRDSLVRWLSDLLAAYGGPKAYEWPNENRPAASDILWSLAEADCVANPIVEEETSSIAGRLSAAYESRHTDVDASVFRLVDRMLEIDPRKRATAFEVLADLLPVAKEDRRATISKLFSASSAPGDMVGVSRVARLGIQLGTVGNMHHVAKFDASLFGPFIHEVVGFALVLIKNLRRVTKEQSSRFTNPAQVSACVDRVVHVVLLWLHGATPDTLNAVGAHRIATAALALCEYSMHGVDAAVKCRRFMAAVAASDPNVAKEYEAMQTHTAVANMCMTALRAIDFMLHVPTPADWAISQMSEISLSKGACAGISPEWLENEFAYTACATSIELATKQESATAASVAHLGACVFVRTLLSLIDRVTQSTTIPRGAVDVLRSVLADVMDRPSWPAATVPREKQQQQLRDIVSTTLENKYVFTLAVGMIEKNKKSKPKI